MEHNLRTERVEVIAVKAAGYETAAGTHGPGCSHGETAQVLSLTEFADQYLTYFGFICNHFFSSFFDLKKGKKRKIFVSVNKVTCFPSTISKNLWQKTVLHAWVGVISPNCGEWEGTKEFICDAGRINLLRLVMGYEPAPCTTGENALSTKLLF